MTMLDTATSLPDRFRRPTPRALRSLADFLADSRAKTRTSRPRFVELAVQDLDDDDVTVDWLARVEEGSRVSLAPWELRALHAGLVRIGVAISYLQLLAIAGYVETPQGSPR